MARTIMTFSLDPAIAADLRAISQAEDRPMSRIIDRSLAAYLAGSRDSGAQRIGESA